MDSVERVEVLENKVEVLENKVAELEKLISTLISKGKSDKVVVKTTGFADIYQYRNSLLLTSRSKDVGTYTIKDSLKEIGSKWATVTDKHGAKFIGWMILGVCKEQDMETAITSTVNKLSELQCTLSFNNKGKIEHSEALTI